MINLKSLREEIKTNLSLEDTISILESVGVKLKKCGINQYHFLNDKSFMVGIYNNRVIIKDFGKTSFSGDIVAYLNEFANMELKEATLKVNEYLKNSSIEVNKMIEKEKSLKTPKQIKDYIEYLERDKDKYFTFEHPLFKSEALAIAPIYIYRELSKSAKEEFKRLTCLDIKNQTLLVKIFNYDGETISYKRRRFKGNKWVTASKTAPNNQCYIRDLNKNEPIYNFRRTSRPFKCRVD